MAYPVTIPLEATAVRPTWPELPGSLRSRIERELGASVVHAVSHGSGFTPGFASSLRLATGEHVFVKAADDATRPMFADCYRDEVRKLRALPRGVPAARLRWALDEDGWVVLCLDDIAGRPPHRPWLAEELAATVQTISAMSALLAPAPPGLELPAWRDELADFPSYWDRHQPNGAFATHGDELSTLAHAGLDAGEGDALVHCDLRDDNVVIDTSGRVWVCDWNWPVRGAAWIDLVTLLLSAHGDGHDVEGIVGTDPLTRDVPGGDIDAVLALLAVYFAGASTAAAPPTSPWLRVHQRWYADVTWDWLALRRGWR